MKLNLGCGNRIKPTSEGWVNVDKFQNADGTVDFLTDLEDERWPWGDNSIDEVFMSHVLEHLGETSENFINIMQELYRVCKDKAIIKIIVPYPFSEGMIADPTHKRAITPTTICLFSKTKNEEYVKNNYPNSTLALYYGVDFHLIDTEGVTFADVPQTLVNSYQFYVNVVADWKMTVEVRKSWK